MNILNKSGPCSTPPDVTSNIRDFQPECELKDIQRVYTNLRELSDEITQRLRLDQRLRESLCIQHQLGDQIPQIDDIA